MLPHTASAAAHKPQPPTTKTAPPHQQSTLLIHSDRDLQHAYNLSSLIFILKVPTVRESSRLVAMAESTEIGNLSHYYPRNLQSCPSCKGSFIELTVSNDKTTLSTTPIPSPNTRRPPRFPIKCSRPLQVYPAQNPSRVGRVRSNWCSSISTGWCIEGSKIVELCQKGDQLLDEEIAKVYKGKKIAKGETTFLFLSPSISPCQGTARN